MMAEGLQKRRRASFYTLGCRLNQYETKLLSDQAEAAGYTIVPFGEPADLVILNTCTVTAQADLKCRYEIRKILRKNPQAYCAVVGCYSQMGYRELAEIEGVDLILGNHDKLNVFDYIAEEKAERAVIVRERIDPSDFSLRIVGERPFPYRANLKVQDGCDFMCSFCIIPFARGRARSRAWENLLEEAHNLAARGVCELILTGVNIGTYNSDGRGIVEMVDALNAVPGIERIRISSIEPTTIPEDLFPRMADPAHALLPFLHIPLQSGCDRILQEMRRRYTWREFADFIDLADRSVPDLCIGTDILVGFPGESEADFTETCKRFLDSPFAYTHVFTYSERGNTPAARRSDSVDTKERQRRSALLRELSARRRREYAQRFLGREMQVLFEDPAEGHWPGYTPNFIRVLAKDERHLRNRMATVRLERICADYVEGCVLEVLEPAAAL